MSTWIHLYVPGTPGYVLSSSLPFDPGGAATADKSAGKPAGDPRPKVLVVDDERIIADSVAAILNRSGFDAVARYDGMSALEYLKQECPDILLSDVVMPELNGVQVAKAANSKCPGTRIVLISGNAATPNLLEHASPGGHPYELLAKPIHPTQLIQILKG